MHATIPALPLAANFDFSRAAAGLGIRRLPRTSNKRIRLRNAARISSPAGFLCRGNLHNSRRQESHSYGKSGWSLLQPPNHFSVILIQDFSFVKLGRLAFP